MEDSVAQNKVGRRLFHNLISGLIGFVVASALLLMALRVQDFLPGGFLSALLYVCPIPVACGLLVGFVSPTKAVAWAPLWSAILAVLLFVMISGSVREIGAAFSSVRVGSMIAGGLIAALSGWVGQWAARRSHVGKLVVALIAVCCLLAGLGSLLLQNQLTAYQSEMRPQVLLAVDKDYIALPRGMVWDCERLIPENCYALSSTLNGQPIRVLAAPDAPALVCVEYAREGQRLNLRTTKAARLYLTKLGVRESLARDLSQSKGAPGHWSSVLQATRLSVESDGRVRIAGIPLRGVSRESTP